nr:hypothetical protein [Tanacetum cinerariifolium]
FWLGPQPHGQARRAAAADLRPAVARHVWGAGAGDEAGPAGRIWRHGLHHWQVRHCHAAAAGQAYAGSVRHDGPVHLRGSQLNTAPLRPAPGAVPALYQGGNLA